MERRKFIRNVGLGASFGAINQNKLFESYSEEIISYEYQKPKEITDCVNDLGYLSVWFEFAGKFSDVSAIKNNFKINGGNIIKLEHYHFYSGEIILDKDIPPSAFVKIIVVIWLDEFSENSEIQINSDDRLKFKLKELMELPELKKNFLSVHIISKILLHNEIGEIDFNKAFNSGPIDEEEFSFVLMADPQGGDPDCKGNRAPTRVKIHNAFIEDSIGLVNNLEEQPVFTMVVGDYTDSQGEKENYQAMEKMYSKLKSPLLLEIGNHETRYNMKSEPGYFMDGFSNFFTAQKRINGLEKLLYSFNIRRYHFVVWPDPLRHNFWENHPHYFEWLERDLEKYKNNPTFFFQHVPIHPIGIDPIQNYSESAYIKRKLMKILSKWGNVNYVFSGHVHIPIKSSVKTACNYQGIKFINLPAAGYRPRAFGEEDYFGGPTQGIAVVSVKKDKIDVIYKDVTHNVYHYPSDFKELTPEKEKLWFFYKWELPLNKSIVNGNFDGLNNWHQPFVYHEDVHPANICEIKKNDGQNALFLRTKKRGYDSPGQDRLPQTLNSVCQAVFVKNGKIPSLSFEIKIAEGSEESEALKGVYIWCEGFSGPNKLFNLIYSNGIAPGNLRSRSEAGSGYKTVHFDLPVTEDSWAKVSLNLKVDAEEHDCEIMDVDRLVISLGVWNVNDGNNSGTAVYFRNLESFISQDENPSLCDIQKIKVKNQESIYYPKVVHIAGEHTLGQQEQLYF